jgi:peptidoglycan/LPS O-acetylase OafA/YrhL
MDFRRDINGLRAWAVLLVMLYHFGVPGFSGGFVGVDVFFVISGYLMTGILLRRRDAAVLTIRDFYLARARRIVPALAVLCVVLLLFGFFWLSALDYRTLSKHALSAIAFISNFVFNNEAGYFDADSHEKWLLHTWSLSVEWQFYLLFPLLLAGIRRYRAGSEGQVMLLLLLASFALALLQVESDPAAAFFLLPARAWELLAGGLVFFYGARMGRWIVRPHYFEWLGLGLILLAGTGLADPLRWPGGMALLPVGGAVLVMLAARGDSRLTGATPVQSIGRWSYSIYLWHWPLFVGIRYFGLELGLLMQLALTGVSILIGYFSWRYVEEHARHGRLARSIRWRGMFAGMLLVVVPAAIVSENRGVPQRLPAQAEAIEAEALNKKSILPRCGWDPEGIGFPECRFGRPGVTPSIAVWGDSHAQASMPSIAAMAERAGRAVVLYNENSCPPILGAIRDNPSRSRDCREFNSAVQARLIDNRNIDTVIFMARWPVYLEGSNETAVHPYAYFADAPLSQPQARRARYAAQLVHTLCSTAARKRVYVVAPLPEFGMHVPKAMVRSLLMQGRAIAPEITIAAYRERARTILAALDQAAVQCGVSVLDPLESLCSNGICSASRDGLPIYFDDDHPGRQGNIALAPMFAKVEFPHSQHKVRP